MLKYMGSLLSQFSFSYLFLPTVWQARGYNSRASVHKIVVGVARKLPYTPSPFLLISFEALCNSL